MAKAMKNVIEKMGGRMASIGEEENMDEGDEEKRVESENGDGGVSSPDMDDMADIGFHQPSQHDTAFHKESQKQADEESRRQAKKDFRKRADTDFLTALREQAEEEVK